MESTTDLLPPCKMLPLQHITVQPTIAIMSPLPFLINSFAHPSEPVLILVIFLDYLLLVSSFMPIFILYCLSGSNYFIQLLCQFNFQGLPMNIITAISMILLDLAIWTFCNI
jgi:hypothetical protein